MSEKSVADRSTSTQPLLKSETHPPNSPPSMAKLARYGACAGLGLFVVALTATFGVTLATSKAGESSGHFVKRSPQRRLSFSKDSFSLDEVVNNVYR